MNQDEFYKDKYFERIEKRFDLLEEKIDKLTNKVTWIYAWSAGAGALAGFIINVIFIMKK